MRQKPFIIVRGGGDLATGTIHRLWAAGFPVLVLETDHPAAIRRQVAVCEAVYEGRSFVFLDYEVLISEPHSFDCVPSVTINLFPFIFFRWDGSDITLVGGIVRMNMYLHCFYLHFTSFERCKDSANRKQNKMNLFIFYFEVPPIFAFEQR